MVILEVLAGGCTPTEAATRLGLSLPRYYQLEARAVEGLVCACQPKPLGKQPSPDTRLAALEKQLRQVQRECARQQALVRATQRSASLSLPAKPTATKPHGQAEARSAPEATAHGARLEGRRDSAESACWRGGRGDTTRRVAVVFRSGADGRCRSVTGTNTGS